MVRSFVPLAVWTTLLGAGWTVAKPPKAHTDDNATYDYVRTTLLSSVETWRVG
ncbi:hypothetical protein GGTG_13705 [Gaeumannomyces tritici R3-111a-1]|uniref:Uncharacterized protein n=1 Tax=Gaeumannomyces tritici (strain R3-111a-1) TaxID=644352 RepID=J3PJL8_GAET3|nr:hypothetical protein GGTG_13705 [Gaeumannomyces tritici R3-111a-1]EJT68718.1 hypothetical protein GGTG_13705 [Gaeumannomyces tritici R3-111a-1]